MKHYSIAIDGPSGAGKSTIAKLLSRRLGFIYVDTGAMYRALALFCIQKGIDASREEEVAAVLGEAVVDIRFEEGEQHVLLCGKDVTGELRKEEVGNMASVISAYPFVRSHLLQLQRFLADQNHVVMDGRDIASTVLPGADVKIFLTASPRERAKRRYKELIRRGEQPLLSRIEEDIKRRDERDMNRSFSPLVRTEDATVIDSSLMSIDEVVVAIERVFQCIK